MPYPEMDALRAALADRYEIGRELGHGGMATVFLAKDLRHERDVAIKIIHSDLTRAIGGQRFLREIAIAARLQHPNILTLIDSGEAGGLLYYVMPFVDGETLRSRIASGPMSVADAMRIFREVAEALAYAHASGMIHRDIKPENVMLSNRHALILDFGVAKAVDDTEARQHLTTEGSSLGTPTYMAPEQVTADPACDKRADIYSAGIVAYEMLTGKPPFTGTSQQVMSAHVIAAPDPVRQRRSDVPEEVESIVMKCLNKDPKDRYGSADDLLAELESLITPAGSTLQVQESSRVRSKRMLVGGAVLGVAVLAGIGYWLTSGIRDERWLRNTGIPAIERYAEADLADSALLMANKAIRIAPKDSALNLLLGRFSRAGVLTTEPAGAKVFASLVGDTSNWEYLGTTPTDTIRFSMRPPSRIRIEKQGYETLNRFLAFFPVKPLAMDSSTPRTRNMVRIPGGDLGGALPGLDNLPAIALGDYRIGKYEVTNREFKKFVDAGGYTRKEFWDFPFIKNGKTLAFSDAIALFTDRTGRLSPATWEAGDIPQGQDEYAVSGLSWYEAAAFAKFSGKTLPSIYHWARAATVGLTAFVVPSSNFSGKGPVRADIGGGMSGVGVFNMAGNVREWCFNVSNGKRYILGGGWNDEPYTAIDAITQDPFDRSVTNGVRLMEPVAAEPNLAKAMAPVPRGFRDYALEQPVSNAEFRSFLSLYDYDKLPLDAKVEEKRTEAVSVREKVTFNAAYGRERVIAYLYLPKRGTPPFQTVVYFPGSNALHTEKAEGNLETDRIDFLLKSGRAILYPIYKSTYERGDSLNSDYADTTIYYRNHVVMWANDLRRSVDYLATRKDIDVSRLGYLGISWGGTLGAIMIPVEPRIKAAVLYVAGLPVERSRPEVDQINFLPRLKIPVIMLNGKYDHFFPVESSQKPFFELIGTPAQHKKYILYEGGHFVPRTQLIAESLNWFDRYLGPVK